MAKPTEQIAIWILSALKEEWERNPSHLTCRAESEVLGALKSKHKIEDQDITRGIRFLIDHKAIEAVNREDGRATLPTTIGLKMMEDHVSTKKAMGWTLDRRLVLYGLMFTIGLALVGLIVQWLTK